MVVRARIGVLLVAVSLASASGAAARSASTALAPIVTCDENVGTTEWPYLGNSQPRFRYRLVLGVIAVPAAYLEQVVATRREPWAHGWGYWRKAGLVIRSGSPTVSVSVPVSWRHRVAITWASAIGGSLRVASCPSPPNVGNAYAGGFLFSAPSVCVPLVFRIGTRSAIVRFGLGRRCS